MFHFLLDLWLKFTGHIIDKAGTKSQNLINRTPLLLHIQHKFRRFKKLIVFALVVSLIAMAWFGSQATYNDRVREEAQAANAPARVTAPGTNDGPIDPFCTPNCSVTVTELPNTSTTPATTPVPSSSGEDDGKVNVKVMGVERQLPNLGPCPSPQGPPLAHHLARSRQPARR